ncbi:DUF6744 family protein [Brevibacillus marinus]|uniref:DUF6744 family protein n=1 Tax=Brevibacillus marinus TaxID=2496837 RepID=UPI000F8169A4|nr:DUF6744 family protein [Brevibacillus marinus]
MELKNLAVVQNETSHVLGYLTWYSLSESLYSRDLLRDSLRKAGLGDEWLPGEIRVPDAFRRATKAVECKRFSDQEGIHFNFLIREVASDASMIQRNIVCETVDRNGRRLDYDPRAAILVLSREYSTIDVTAFSKAAEELAQEAVNLFYHYLNNYSSQAVRQMVYSILKSMAPTPVRPSGGIYFVPGRHKERLKALCSFLSYLDGGKGVSVPVINDRDSRDMIREGLKDHLKSVLESCHQGIKRNLPKNQLKVLLHDARSVIGDFKDYEAILQEEVENMNTYIDLIRQQVKVLMDKITE